MTGGWLYWLRQMAAASTTLVSGHDAGVRASWAHAESSSRLPTSAAEPLAQPACEHLFVPIHVHKACYSAISSTAAPQMYKSPLRRPLRAA